MSNPKLEVEIKTKLDNIDREFSRITAMSLDTAKRIDGAFAGINLSGLFAGLGAGAFIGLTRDVANAGDELAKMSTRTGIAVEELSKLTYAASLSDVSNEDLASSLGRLNKVLGEAADGSKEATAALASFGIAPGTLNASEAFNQIADRVKNTGDQTKIASAMNDIFGKSWATLVPLIKNGSDGLKEAGDELEKLGGVMSGELAAASERFNDSLTKISKSLDALKVQSLGPVVQGLDSLTAKFVEATKAAGGFWSGMFAWGTTSGKQEGDPGQAIANLVLKLNTLKEMKAGLEAPTLANKLGFNTDDITIVNKQISVLTTQLEYLKGLNSAKAGSLTDSWMRAPTGQGITGTPAAVKLPKAAKKTKADDPFADFYADLEARIKPAEQALDSFRQMQLDAAVAGADLTAAEKKFYDLINSPEWATMAEPWKELVTAQFEAANSAGNMAEEQKKLNDLLAATPTAKQQELVDITILLDKAFKDGRISAEQLSEAVSAAAGTATDSMQQATDTINTFAEQAARNMQDALADFLFDPFDEGLDGMLKGFGETLQKMIAQAVAADIAKKVFGKAGGGEGEGLLGAGLGWLAGLIPNASGGVYTSPGLSAYSGQIVSKPTVFPFASGIGLMGEAGPEAILPLKRGTDGKLGVSAGGSPVNITVNVTGTTAPDVRRAAAQGAREALSALNSAKRYS